MKELLGKLFSKKSEAWNKMMVNIIVIAFAVDFLAGIIGMIALGAIMGPIGNLASLVFKVALVVYVAYVAYRVSQGDVIPVEKVNKLAQPMDWTKHVYVLGIMLGIAAVKKILSLVVMWSIGYNIVTNLLFAVLGVVFNVVFWYYASHAAIRLYNGDKFKAFIPCTIAYAVAAFLYYAYSFALEKILILMIALAVCTLWRTFGRFHKKAGGYCALVGILFAFGLYLMMPQANTVTSRETYIADITYVYNEDGTIKHNSDGSKVLDTDYETREVSGYGTNYTLLLFPVLGIGAMCYGLKEQDEIEK